MYSFSKNSIYLRMWGQLWLIYFMEIGYHVSDKINSIASYDCPATVRKIIEAKWFWWRR